MQIAMTIIHIIICIALIVFVLFQNSKDAGLGSTFGGQDYSDRPKARTTDDILSKWTIIFSVLFVISTFVLSFIY